MSDEIFTYDVFLSHSTKDMAVVRALAERLRADGLEVWLDEWVLKPGDSIQAKIDDGLDHSRVLVLCMSANAYGSEWAQLEAGTFRFRDPLNRERRFIPLRLDDAPVMGSLKQFLHISWLPMARENGYAQLLEACRVRSHMKQAPNISTNEASMLIEVVPDSARWPRMWLMDGLEAIRGIHENSGVAGITTGFTALDSLTGGLHSGELYVIAGRPSMGKTAFAINIVEYAAIEGGHPCIIYSFLMSSRSLAQRILCSRALVSTGRVRDGCLTDKDLRALSIAASEISEAPLLIDDVAPNTWQEMIQRIRFCVRAHEIRLAVIDDYGTLYSTGLSPREQQREVSEIAFGIKALAKELKIPIIVLVTLDRKVEQRRSGMPRLKDTGSIERAADVVCLLVRHEYYAEDEDEREAAEGRSTLVVAKQRNGGVGDIPLNFLKEFARFENQNTTLEPS